MSPEEEEFIGALQNKNYIIFKFTKLPYGGSINNKPVWGKYGLPIIARTEWMHWEELVRHSRYNDSNNGWVPFHKQNAKDKGII